MTVARVFGSLAFAWSLGIGVLYCLNIFSSDMRGLFVALFGLTVIAISLIGVFGVERGVGWTWLSAAVLSVFIFSPGFLGLPLIPGSLAMMIAAVAQSLSNDTGKRSVPTGGGRA